MAALNVEMKKLCEHEKHSHPNVIRINEPGNICDDLPFLAQTCHKILGEMWISCFSKLESIGPEIKKAEKAQVLAKIEYEAKVKNFDYFPLFRFFQMLHRKERGVDVKGHMVRILLVDDFAEEATWNTKFSKVERLLEMHWLDNLPLWGCLTGLKKVDGLKAIFQGRRANLLAGRIGSRRGRCKNYIVRVFSFAEEGCRFIPHQPSSLARHVNQVSEVLGQFRG